MNSMTIPNKRVAVLSPVAWRTPPRQYGALLTTEVAPPELAPVPAPCVMLKEVAPTVTVPLRLALVVLTCTEYVNDPAPLPLAPATIEIQSALLVAVQEDPTAAVTVT